MPKYCDTHTHLDFHQFDVDREETIQRAFSTDVVRIINIGVDLDSSIRSIELAERYPQIWCAVGIHPHDVQNQPTGWLNTLEKLAYHPKVVAIGEIGLDFYRDISPRESQIEAFARQIMLAQKLELPMIIHIRDAHKQARQIMENIGYYYGVFHAYSGDEDFLEWALDKNMNIGFGGPITFKNYRKHHLIKKTPIEKIFLETDCPYLSPHPYRGKRNEPSLIPTIAEKVSELKNIPMERVAKATTENAVRLFGFPSPYMKMGKKYLGQNFLTNSGVAQKIANLAGTGKLALEIGAGKGIITNILTPNFDRVIAVELDEYIALQADEKIDSPNCFVLQQDILKLNLVRLSKYYQTRITLVGNIPYSITTPILFWALKHIDGVKSAIFTIQREVGERICAQPGTKDYGIPTVILNRYFEINKEFTISPGSFFPVPQITSIVVKLSPRAEPIIPELDHDKFSNLVHCAFAKRRKKLISNLQDVSEHIDWKKILQDLGYGENVRAEQISVQAFCRLASHL
ncbi:ribosomal RNA small subunit methyltransferase A [bacterium]|nr:MAG: ribosomal RNA small subunit methyltransferase A [bacterium]